MRGYTYLYIAVFLVIGIGITCLEQNLTTYGSDFYVGFFEHPHTATIHRLYVHTLKETSVTFKVTSLDGNFTHTGTCSLNKVATVDVPQSYEIRGYSYAWRFKGLRISSLETEPMSVIGWSYRNNADFMAFLAYPCHVQPVEEYIYYAISSLGWSNQKSIILLIGCKDNTSINITTKAVVSVPEDLQDSNSQTLILEAGETHSITLNSLQTLMIHAVYADLTGSKIVSNKPITVMSGHEAARIPAGVYDADPIVTQIPSTVQWGKKFLLSPHAGRKGQYYRIIFHKNNTVIERTCGIYSIINSIHHAEEWLEFSTLGNTYCSIIASEAIYLAQLGVSHDYKSGFFGDPSLQTIPPIEQFSNSVQYSTFGVAQNYYSVVVPNDPKFTYQIVFDSNLQNITNWNIIYYANRSIAGYGYTAQTSGSHTVSHPDPDGKLFVSVYGWTTYGGYSYSAGMNLNPINHANVLTQITFIESKFLANENQSVVVIKLERQKEFAKNVSVLLSVLPVPLSTAEGGKDYVTINEVITFEANGEIAKSVSIAIINDTIAEPTEYFTIMIEPIMGDVAFPLNEAVVEIVDDDVVNIGFTNSEFYFTDEHKARVIISIKNGKLQDGHSVNLLVRVIIDGSTVNTIEAQLSAFNYMTALNFDLTEVPSYSSNSKQSIVCTLLQSAQNPINVELAMDYASIIHTSISSTLYTVHTITAEKLNSMNANYSLQPGISRVTSDSLKNQISVSSGGLYFGIGFITLLFIGTVVVGVISSLLAYHQGKRKASRDQANEAVVHMHMSASNELYKENDNESVSSLQIT